MQSEGIIYDFVQLDKAVKIQFRGRKLLNTTGRRTFTVLTVLPSGKYKKCKHEDALFAPKLSCN